MARPAPEGISRRPVGDHYVHRAMLPEPALIIIHNHRFPRNIGLLDDLYRDRFPVVRHLMPFHQGNEPHVIAVHEHSHQFQGYVAQGLKHFHDPAKPHAHYLFVADDLLLNPRVDASNYREHLGLRPNSGFLPGFIQLHQHGSHWRRIPESMRYRRDPAGVFGARELPSVEEAVERFARHGLEHGKIAAHLIAGPRSHKEGPLELMRWLRQRMRAPRSGAKPPYPLVGGYSDIFAVPGASMAQFAHYCGVFAATRLFVELAIPTAMALSVDHVSTERDTLLKGRALWSAEDLALLEPYGFDLQALLRAFPEGHLYLHPVKLSQWK